MANMITLTVGDDVTTEMFKSYINEKAYSQIDLRDILPVRPVEMTELQVAQMMSFKEIGAGFSTFMYKQGLGQVPAFEDWIKTKREDELMTAWLHPETIKVVDDD